MAAVGSLVPGAALATLLTFEGLDNGFIPASYGDNTGDTPDVIADWGASAKKRVNGGALTDVGYATDGVFNLMLTGQDGHSVLLHGFDLGSKVADYTISSVKVKDGDNNTLFSQTDVDLFADGVTSFNFDGPLTAESIKIIVKANNIDVVTRVGIDNINFGQDPSSVSVPEPTTLALMSSGLLGLALFGRRRD